MINTGSKIFTGVIILAAILTMGLGGCKKDAANIVKTTYQLKTKDQLGVSGTVTFTQTSTAVTTIEIVLTGGDVVDHPAHIHMNSAVEGGGIAISLSPVVSGKSTTVVTALDNGTSINYAQLIVFDGYVNVHESSSNLGTIVAQGDIGGNLVTSANKTYPLDTVGAFGVSGTALFEKRLNGKTLVSVSVNGTIGSTSYPTAIRLGSVTTVGGGPVKMTLSPIDGTTGKSYTNIRTLDDQTSIGYDDLMVYDGYLTIQQAAVVICQGNIGTH